jgi:hypothetical protein
MDQVTIGAKTTIGSIVSKPHQDGMAHPNGEVVQGDLDYDGRVILYIITGRSRFYVHNKP